MTKKLVLWVVVWWSCVVYAEHSRTQYIELSKGWNAVYLEVEPDLSSPDQLFADLPVDLVTTYYPNRTPVEFIDEPNEDTWKKAGWHKWMPASRPDAFLNNLYQLNAGHAYLVHATEAFQWALSGQARWVNTQWASNAFNLIGFSVDPAQAPTFSEFFKSSAAHQNLVAYTLRDEHWHLIDKPESTLIESGKAYWIYTKGGSSFQGPLYVQSQTGGYALNFQMPTLRLELTLQNVSDSPIYYSVKPIASLSQEPPVALQVELRSALNNQMSADFSLLDQVALESMQRVALNFVVDRAQMTVQPSYQSILQIRGAGMVYYIPVTADKQP